MFKVSYTREQSEIAIRIKKKKDDIVDLSLK